MKVHNGHAAGGASLALIASAAMASPIPLDSEQKAASGVVAALHTSHNAPIFLHLLAGDTLEHVERAMTTLNAHTTASDLMATRGGVTVACDVAGSLTAKLANAFPRVLRLTWNGCIDLIFGEERTFTGTAAITLPADTLAPEYVEAIRLGNANQPFLEQFRHVEPEQTDNTSISYDVSLRGQIWLTRAFGGFGELVGASSYELHGYKNEERFLEFPSPTPPVHLGVKISAQRAMILASSSMSEDGSIVEDDLQALRGSISFTQTSPEPDGVTTEAYQFNGYRVRTVTDWNAFSRQLFIDGKVNVTWNPFFGAGCMNGLYSFRTRAPMISADLNSPTFASGDLLVNGSVVARFFSPDNVPSTLPTPVNGMLVNMRVRDVGTFNYDAASLQDALMPVAQCQM